MTTPSASAAAPAPAPAATTRTCVKNLPPSLTAPKLQSHLRAAQPALRITDCRLLTTKEGKSRKIAFVGFATADMAEAAVKYFHRSYIGTARLDVSLAFSKKRGAEKEGYRPWSKHSAGSSRYAKLHPQEEEGNEGAADATHNEADGGADDVKNDADEERQRKKDEFLSAMGISTSSDKGKDAKASKSKFWANDDAVVDPSEATNAANTAGEDENGSESDSSSDNSSSSSDSDSEDKDNAAADEIAKKAKGPSTDLDFLRSKQVQADDLADESDGEGGEGENEGSDSSSGDSSSDSDSDDSSSSEDEEEVEEGESNEGAPLPISAAVKERDDPATNAPAGDALDDRLFVRNLPFTTTEEDLHETFSHFGAVASVHIPVDDSKRNKGYAFVAFERKEDARMAMETMDGEDFQGRLIHILPARPSVDHSKDVDEKNLTYKERQELARQKEADKASQGWSASFLRGDAVADNISDRLGVSKGDVLNVKDGISSGNAAVRLALGETHIISENVAFFEEHGVDVTALESNAGNGKKGAKKEAPKRSKTMILVKNLPYDTSHEDLTKVFHGIGGDAPVRISLPPSKTAALVEYGHATDARRAFRRLAYRKFKHVPLYLEWAPMREGGKGEASRDGDAAKSDGRKEAESDGTAIGKRGLADEDASAEAADAGVSQTIYVKNLNFSTSEEALERAFTKAGFQPRAVKIPKKAAPVKKSKASSANNADSNETKQLSLGFGFVEFPSEEEALKAMKSLQGKIVDGHALEIKLSTKNLSSSSKAPSANNDPSSRTTKIMVRNVPFEATRSELLRLFGAFGQLKRVRLPKKFDGTHRGFAFVEFVTKKEAAKAMAALSRTHLYGRHLVLEWAAAEAEGGDANDIEAVRERAKRDALRAGLGGVGGSGGKKRKSKHLKF